MLKGRLCTVRHLVSTDLNTFIALVNDLPSRGDHFSTHFKSPETLRKEFMQNSFVTDDSELFVIEDSLHHIVGVITHFNTTLKGFVGQGRVSSVATSDGEISMDPAAMPRLTASAAMSSSRISGLNSVTTPASDCTAGRFSTGRPA
jgi:hypothetical protein